MKETLVCELILNHLPGNKRKNNSGYYINCPMCVDYGQNRNDTRFRCGITFLNKDVLIHCYNCNFAARYDYSSKILSKKLKAFMYKLNVSDYDIKKVILQSRYFTSYTPPQKQIKKYELPNNTLSFSEIIKNNILEETFNNCLEYLLSRGSFYSEYLDFVYWSDTLPNEIIFPIKRNNEVLGYVQRNIKTKKYFAQIDNSEIYISPLYKENFKYLFVFESCFDALIFGGCSVLGKNINEQQVNKLKELNSNIILVPDKDADSKYFIETSIKYNFKISMPWPNTNNVLKWPNEVKDAEEAARILGLEPTLLSLIVNATNNKAKILLEKNLYA